MVTMKLSYLDLYLYCYLWWDLVICGFMFQINEEAKKFSSQTGLRVVVAYGGTPIYDQVGAAFFHGFYFSEQTLFCCPFVQSSLIFKQFRCSVSVEVEQSLENSTYNICQRSFYLEFLCGTQK